MSSFLVLMVRYQINLNNAELNVVRQIKTGAITVDGSSTVTFIGTDSHNVDSITGLVRSCRPWYSLSICVDVMSL